MGVERLVPDSSAAARAHNFTNEGGYDKRFRYLKNIMGLWIIQSIRKELGGKYSFAELCDMATALGDTPYRINVNDSAFLAPDSMMGAIKDYCNAPDMPLDHILCCVYHSLAECYAETIKEICEVTGRAPEALHIIGGGSKNGFLNELTAKYTGKKIITGPTEGTAIGNLMMQMVGGGDIADVAEGRKIVKASFDIAEL